VSGVVAFCHGNVCFSDNRRCFQFDKFLCHLGAPPLGW
jgi:hypothetical protein